MANFSAEFLEVDDFDKTPNLHRSRSGGYVDYLEEQARWDRRDRERQMKRYHDSRYSPQPAPPSDRLYVPAFDTTHRRVRSQDFTEKKEEPAQRYNVREARPQRTYETNAEPPRPTELPIRQKPQRKPTVKVQIHQADPPAPASEKTPKKNLSASPRSPTAVPEVQFRYSTLQHKLGQIETTCSPFVDVEAANPRDLTFAKISEQVKSFAFELESWNYIVRVEDMARIDMGKRHIVEAASRTLGRLIERVTELSSACGKAKPRDLKLEPIPYVDSSDEDFKSDEDDHDDGSVKDVTESLGFVIQCHLDSIQLQLQTLKRLARSLQEATPGAKDEVIAVSGVVAEVGKYFGTQEALDRHGISTRFSGRKALEEARYAAGSS